MGVLHIRDTSTNKFIPITSINGLTPHIGENGNWWVGNVDTGTSASGAGGGVADSVAWGNVTGKPDTYPPAAHTHSEYLGKTETAANANQLNGKSADQYALKTDLPKAGDWDGNTVPNDIPDGISYVESGALTNGHGFPVGYCTVLSCKDNVNRLFQILVEKENGRMQIRSAKDGTTWGEWQPYLRATDTAADSAKLDGKDSVYYRKKFSHPRNLLDNSDFRNPVNQRGETTYYGAGDRDVYTIDRWLFSWQAGAVLTVGKGYIQKNNLPLIQRLKNIDLNKTYTLALCFANGDKRVYSGTFANHFGDFDNFIWGGMTGDVPQVRIAPPVVDPLAWTALYEGEYTADNLPPYVPKGYAAELVECKRYAKMIQGDMVGMVHGYAAGKGYGTIITDGKMRIAPSIADPSTVKIINGEHYSDSFTSVKSISNIDTTENAISFWMEHDGVEAGKDYLISCKSPTLFSSDL